MKYLSLLFLSLASCSLFYFTARFDCGDNILKSGEECDDGNTTDGDGCDQRCFLEVCGNGLLQSGEECDDAETNSDERPNACRANCVNPRCGDAVIDTAEGCDDGNNLDGDGCSAACVAESCGDGAINFDPARNALEQCDDGNTTNGDGCNAQCLSERCSDSLIQAALGEECDDGNNLNGDGCNAACVVERCGDGLINNEAASLEQCDDGNNTDGDGCRADCLGVEQCGDGLVDIDEVCDDGNLTNGDSCRADCQGEELCGDGLLDVNEECDDQNVIDGDGCSALCVEELCGDGAINNASTELCDDGNAIDNDTCDSDCQPSLAIFLSTGVGHSCALTRIGDVRCWGLNATGQLGYGNTTNLGDNEPAKSGGDVNVGRLVTQISVGDSHSCAVLQAGGARCWGTGANGRLGYGNINNIGNDPGEVPAIIGDIDVGGVVTQISAGGAHTCALLDSGVVRCWGNGAGGRLGYGNTNDIGDNEIPSIAGDVSIGGTAAQITAGSSHTCALLTDGSVRCWGVATSGRLGYGNLSTVGDNEVPSSVGTVSVGGLVTQISAGGAHTCALLDAGVVRCWGSAGSGQLGYGNITDIGDSELPSVVGPVNVGGTVTQIVTGSAHTCALLDTGAVRCWGLASSGQLGYGNTNNIGDNEQPFSVGNVNVGEIVTQLSAGETHTCALLDTGAIRCWGSNASGQLGYGVNVIVGDNELPVQAGDVPVF